MPADRRDQRERQQKLASAFEHGRDVPLNLPASQESHGIFAVCWREICSKVRVMELLACGNPFRNIGPIGWLVVSLLFTGLAIGCVLAIVNPVLAATMKTPPERKRLHLGLAAVCIVPGILFALVAMTESGMASGLPVMGLLIYLFALPLWTGVHFIVLLSIRRELRQAAANLPPDQ